MAGSRQPAYRRNPSLERLLKELNDVLGAAEAGLDRLPKGPRFPVIFVVGPPRSGTTLFMQWLAGTDLFAVPTNLLSRFYAAPYLGARIQRMLTDPIFDYRQELTDIRAGQIGFCSELGKTKGALQPNEYWYFWRRFIPNIEPRWLTPEEEGLIDREGFRAGIAAIEAALEKPVATKGIILQYNLRVLREIFPTSLFVHTVRDPFYNVQSLLKARREYFGDERAWYSVQPKEHATLRCLPPEEQVAGQVYCTNRHIQDELRRMDPAHGLTVSYERFSAAPEQVYQSIVERLRGWGYPASPIYRGPRRFEVQNHTTVSKDREMLIRASYSKFADADSQPRTLADDGELGPIAGEHAGG